MTWSSSSFLSILQKGQGLGSSTCLLAPYMIGLTYKEHSSGTSRAPTSALGALGTSRCARKRAEKASETTSGGSHKKRNKLLDITDIDVVSAFTYGTSNKALVHKLEQGRPKTIVDLFDIANKFVDGEDAVGRFSPKEKFARRQCAQWRERDR